MEFFVQPNGSLFKLSEGEYNFILDLIRDENPAPVRQASADSYTRVDFLHDVFLSEQRYEVLVSLLRHKKISFCKVHPALERPMLPNGWRTL